jgi:hypothetical protein
MRRLAWTLLVGGAAGWGVAALLRGGDRTGVLVAVSYLCNVTGTFALLGGAVLEARVAALLFAVRAKAERRRAVLEVVGGIVATLAGCVGFGVAGEVEAMRALLSGLLGLGIGVGLAGGLALGWHVGLDWAAGRMERLDHAGVDEARRRLRDRR